MLYEILKTFFSFRFCERAQALLHGDLHTSSVMVTHESTQVLDPEFAFYGPMGFDIGAFLGNLILAFFAQNGHADQVNDRKVCPVSVTARVFIFSFEKYLILLKTSKSLSVFNLMVFISKNHFFFCKISGVEANARLPVNNKHVTFIFFDRSFPSCLDFETMLKFSLIYLCGKRENGTWKKMPPW